MKRAMQVAMLMAVLGGVSVAQAPATPPVAVPAQQSAPTAADGGTKLTDKQKALADQADRLLALANELQARVDVTSKNILSLKVVQKAEEIESLAKQMKGQTQAKK